MHPSTTAQIIVFIIFASFGVGMLCVGVKQFFQQKRLLRRAQPITATIIKSEVFSSKSADTDASLQRNTSTTTHRPDVVFRYESNGKSYESDLLYPNVIVVTSASREAAAAELAPFPVNAKVPAYVDPSQPDKAFLIPQAGAGPIVFIIVGLIILPIAWFGSTLV